MRDGAAAAGRSFDAIDIEAGGAVEFTDDVDEAAARHARGIAFTLGAMGSPTTNFYNDAFVRQGWADEAKAVQRLWVDGKRDEARDRVPVELAMKINCLGTEEMVRDRLRVYRDAGVTTFRAGVDGTIDERIETLGGLMRLVGEINAE
jgi:alkanesulfonate monooxygenase SsuD/methylene tetrahydromethanopterin reductase-like flavin-dependent oxidoreductase (luciferase family)